MPKTPKTPKPKTTTRKPAARRTVRKKTVQLAHEHIATRAYFIHLSEGGDPQANWLRAEGELLAA